MIYSNTDIILCFSGIGRTFFSKDSLFALDKDFDGKDAKAFADEIAKLKLLKKYRYILVPMNDKIRDDLEAKSVPFITVVPLLHQWDGWSKRWLKAGATAEQLNARLTDWNKYYKELEGWDYDDFTKPIIHLKDDEWLGNVLCQSNEPIAKE
jgi:hypothetical protein